MLRGGRVNAWVSLQPQCWLWGCRRSRVQGAGTALGSGEGKASSRGRSGGGDNGAGRDNVSVRGVGSVLLGEAGVRCSALPYGSGGWPWGSRQWAGEWGSPALIWVSPGSSLSYRDALSHLWAGTPELLVPVGCMEGQGDEHRILVHRCQSVLFQQTSCRSRWASSSLGEHTRFAAE